MASNLGDPLFHPKLDAFSSRKLKPLNQQRSKLQGLEGKLLQMSQVYYHNYEGHHLYFHSSVSRLANLGIGRNSTICWLLVRSIYYILHPSSLRFDFPIRACHRLIIAYCFTPNTLSTIGSARCWRPRGRPTSMVIYTSWRACFSSGSTLACVCGRDNTCIFQDLDDGKKKQNNKKTSAFPKRISYCILLPLLTRRRSSNRCDLSLRTFIPLPPGAR